VQKFKKAPAPKGEGYIVHQVGFNYKYYQEAQSAKHKKKIVHAKFYFLLCSCVLCSFCYAAVPEM
jgi:hypothetical protein